MACADHASCEIAPLRELFFELDGELLDHDVATIKGLLQGKQLKRSVLDKLVSANDVFLELESQGYISESNLKLLLNLFRCLKRFPLKDRVVEFLEEHGHRKLKKPAEVSIKVDFGDDCQMNITKKMSKEEAMFLISSLLQSKITSWSDVPEAKAHIESIGGITCERVEHSCIEFIVSCVTKEGATWLWKEYTGGKLHPVFQRGIVTEEVLEAAGATDIPISLCISEDEYNSLCTEIDRMSATASELITLRVADWHVSSYDDLGPISEEMWHEISHIVNSSITWYDMFLLRMWLEREDSLRSASDKPIRMMINHSESTVLGFTSSQDSSVSVLEDLAARFGRSGVISRLLAWLRAKGNHATADRIAQKILKQ